MIEFIVGALVGFVVSVATFAIAILMVPKVIQRVAKSTMSQFNVSDMLGKMLGGLGEKEDEEDNTGEASAKIHHK